MKGRSGSGVRSVSRADRTMIQFNLSDLSSLITDSSQIVSAYLKVKTNQPQAGGSINVDAFRVKKAWNEGVHLYGEQTASTDEVTWTYQLFNSAAWTGAGCDNSTDRQTTPDDTVTVSANGTWYNWNVTDSVKYMFDNPSQNHGWILKSQSEGTSQLLAFLQ